PIKARLRKSPPQEGGTAVLSGPGRTYQEDHILTGLVLGDDAGEVIGGVDGLLIYFRDNVATREANIVGKRTRLHVSDDHALARRQLEFLSNVGRERIDGDAEFALLRLGLFPALVFES